MKKIIVIILNILLVCSVSAQMHPEHKRTWNWLFGETVGLDFSTGQMLLNTPSPCNACYFMGYSNSTISDTAGNLLFHCRGENVRDKYMNQLQPNYGNVLGSRWPPLGSMFLPVPDKDSIFILFTNTGNSWQSNMSMYYSLINKNMNNGLGYIYQANNLLLPHSGGSITAAYTKNEKDFWIVASDSAGNLYSWLLDSSLTLPLVGSYHLTTVSSLYHQSNGDVCAVFTTRPTADLISISNTGQGDTINSFVTSLISFNNGTGQFSNEIVVESGFGPCTDGNYFSAIQSFSPKGNYIYMPFFECPPVAPRNGFIRRYHNVYGITNAAEVQIDTIFISFIGQAPYTITNTPINTMVICNINENDPGHLSNPYISIVLNPDSSFPTLLVNEFPTFSTSVWAPLNNLPPVWYYQPGNVSNIQVVNNYPLEIYPNPADDKIVFKNAENNLLSAVLIDYTGKHVQENYSIKNELNTSTLPNGIYLLKAVSKNGTTKITKVLIQH